MAGRENRFRLVDDDGMPINIDMTPDFFTKRDRRKQNRHIRTARFIDDWGDTIASSVALCADISVGATSFAIFQAMDTAAGKDPSWPSAIVHGVASIGMGFLSYVLVERAAKLYMNSFYNNEAILGVGGMGYLEYLKAMSTPPSQWTEKQAHFADVMNALGDDFLKECEW